MTSCPCEDISHEPDRNNKSLLTVYLMAFCSRLTCTLPASISFFRAAISAELCAIWAADACCCWAYWLCSWLYWPCSALYLPSSASYLPCETQPARRQQPRRAGAGRSVADPRSSWCDLPGGAGQQTRRPRPRLPRDIAKLMLCWTQHSTRTPLRIG